MSTNSAKVLGWMTQVGPVRSLAVSDKFRTMMGAYARYAIAELEATGEVRRFQREGGGTMFVSAAWVAANAGWM